MKPILTYSSKNNFHINSIIIVVFLCFSFISKAQVLKNRDTLKVHSIDFQSDFKPVPIINSFRSFGSASKTKAQRREEHLARIAERKAKNAERKAKKDAKRKLRGAFSIGINNKNTGGNIGNATDSVSTDIIDSDIDAFIHYIFGDEDKVELGENTVSKFFETDGFFEAKDSIKEFFINNPNETTKNSDWERTDLTFTFPVAFHVGVTPFSYKAIRLQNNIVKVEIDLWIDDGFEDALDCENLQKEIEDRLRISFDIGKCDFGSLFRYIPGHTEIEIILYD